MSGIVTATADDVTDFKVGDEVYGLIRFDRDGAAAEYVTVPAADLARRPMTVSHVVSAALPLAGLTAWQALVDHAHVRERERVLVHGGAGGVGALTVEVFVRMNGQATITASDFPPGFLLVGMLAASSAAIFWLLPPNAGAEMANRVPATTSPSDQRMG